MKNVQLTIKEHYSPKYRCRNKFLPLMKILLLIIFFVFWHDLKGQAKKQIFNTTINNAKKVEIKSENGIVEIGKAEGVIIGQVIINQTSKSQLFLTAFNQTQDSTGLYVTTITVSSPGAKLLLDVLIGLKFDKPYESLDWLLGGSAFMYSQNYTDDKRQYEITIGQLITQSGSITAIVKSKLPLFTTIYGINGALN